MIKRRASRPVSLERCILPYLKATLVGSDSPLNEKGLITEAEFMQKLSAERVGYQEMLGKMR